MLCVTRRTKYSTHAKSDKAPSGPSPQVGLRLRPGSKINGAPSRCRQCAALLLFAAVCCGIAWTSRGSAQTPGPSPRAIPSAEPSPKAESPSPISLQARQASSQSSAGSPGADTGVLALTADAAVRIALERNRDVISARLDLKAVQFDQVAAALYANPILSYQVGNLVIGRGNQYAPDSGGPAHPGMFSQTVHAFGISQLIDIWSKRGRRLDVATQNQKVKRLQLEDLFREVAHTVRSAFVDALRAKTQFDFANEVRERYGETLRLSRSRRQAGEISESELRKIELEGLKYQSAVVDATLERDLSRQKLAALMGFDSSVSLPAEFAPLVVPALARDALQLTQIALENRPDYRAALESRKLADNSVALAHREAYPDLTLGVGFVHSGFEISGDNPNTWSVGASMPLPLFDRNQANIGRAQVHTQQTDNDIQRLALQIKYDVTNAERRFQRADDLLVLYRDGGMLMRAEEALRVAERAYKAGAVSLLEFLEAQRTYLEIRDQYLNAVADYQQSAVDLIHALGRKPNEAS